MIESVPAAHATIQDALNAVPAGGIVEITDSGRYAETPAVAVNAGARIELRAANEHRLAASCRYLINGEPTENKAHE